MGSNSKRSTAWTWRQIEATRLRSWFLILTLDFTLFAIFVFVVCSSRPSISFETVKATFPQKKMKKINDNSSINVQNMARRCFRCERTPMTQPRFGNEVAMTYCSVPVLSWVPFTYYSVFLQFFLSDSSYKRSQTIQHFENLSLWKIVYH